MKTPNLPLFSLILLAFTGLCLLSATPAQAAFDLKRDLQTLKGSWQTEVSDENGTTKWTLEVREKTLVLTITDLFGTVQGMAEAEFKLEDHGPFRSIRYHDIVNLKDGDPNDKQLTGGESRSAVYRFHEKDLITVSEVDEDADGEPKLMRWTRKE